LVSTDGAPLAIADEVGAVAIGRNEGERLRRCLESLRRDLRHVVYVDSGSTDDSVAIARALGVTVESLDMNRPFTAARARNAGFQVLQRLAPQLRYVQFVDGDCEVVDGWLALATGRLRSNPALAVVCGRRRERHPDRSIYNRLCDIEWDTPPGPALACGGDALMRVAAFQAVGGFRDDLIAGEEPELCLRLRQAGHGIERLDAEMTLHDAAMDRFGQWWRRSVRAGHAFAEGAHLHGDAPERHWVREYRRILLWGAAVPALALGAAVPTLGASTLLLWGYPLSAARAFAAVRRRGRSADEAALAAAFMTLGKLPELQGVLRFHLGRLAGKRSGLIEYKGAGGG
jgi:GT2 family glycosyltransferase